MGMSIHTIYEILSGLIFLWLAFLWSGVGGNNATIKTMFTLMTVLAAYLVGVHLGIIPEAVLPGNHQHPAG